MIHAIPHAFVDEDGQPVQLRGLGVGSYLNLEHFMLGVPGLDSELRRAMNALIPGFDDAFTEAFFADEDAALIRSLGLNMIRVPVNHRLLMDDQTGVLRPEGFQRLRRLGEICARHQLYFLPDLHTTPGAQNPDWHSESLTGTAEFWRYGALRKQTAALWGHMAELWRDNEWCLGYDLLNEPVLPEGGAALLNAFYRDAIAAVRQVDQQHMVLLEGDRFSMDFTSIDSPDDPNWSYAYHFYPAVWDDRLADPQLPAETRQKAFDSALYQLLATMPDKSRPLLCGECGYELCLLTEEQAMSMTRDTLELLEKRGSGWCLWCYKDARFMGLTYPADDTPWMRLCRAVSAKWQHHAAETLGHTDARRLTEAYAITPEEEYRMQFVIRAMLSHTDMEHILLPEIKKMSNEDKNSLASSFALSHCEVHPALTKLFQTYNDEAGG